MTLNKKILLTGAGFTANFGAPVASQVWNDLFNCIEIQNNKRLLTALKAYRSESDFEGFYHHIIYGNDYTLDEKKIVVKAIIFVYNRINAITEQCFKNSDIDFQRLYYFIKRFSNSEEGTGFIYTLNQDLFIEKLINKHLRGKEGYNDSAVFYPGPINVTYIEDEWKSILPLQKQIDEWMSKSNLGGALYRPRTFPLYVKLHGSSGWIMPNSNLSIPIIGRNKSEQISSQPLLKWYKELFAQQLEDKLDIWIIGYSFMDDHINKLLMKSINDYGSSLFVIDTKSQNNFLECIKKSVPDSFCQAVEEHLAGYIPCGLKELFPVTMVQTFYSEILDRLLNKAQLPDVLDKFISIENSLEMSD